MPLNKPAAWYASEEAVLIGRNILSYQTPAGGWGKNQPRDRPPRARRLCRQQQFQVRHAGRLRPAQGRRLELCGHHRQRRHHHRNPLPDTLAAQAPARPEAYRRRRCGIDYVLHAHSPMVAGPRSTPAGRLSRCGDAERRRRGRGGRAVDAGRQGIGWLRILPQDRRLQAAQAVQRSIQLLLDAQLRQGVQRTLWAQQYDALTLEPVSARNYEPGAPCTAESVGVLVFLMGLPEPSREVQAAVHGGIATLERIAVHGRA